MQKYEYMKIKFSVNIIFQKLPRRHIYQDRRNIIVCMKSSLDLLTVGDVVPETLKTKKIQEADD